MDVMVPYQNILAIRKQLINYLQSNIHVRCLRVPEKNVFEKGLESMSYKVIVILESFGQMLWLKFFSTRI